MKNEVWYLENFDFYNILCPYKMADHVKEKPNEVLSKNEFLFMERDPCREIILIDKGKVKVGHYDEEGNETVLTFLGKGEILGQMALLGQTEHRAFAEVMEDGTQVCRLSVKKAKELTRDYMPFALEINRRIGDHVRKLERRIELLTCKNVKTRMLEFLYDLGKDYGRPRDGGIWISHNLTQSDIGALLGTSRKSASLCLNDLEEDGLIRFDRRHIFLVSPDQLEQHIAEHRKSLI
ncbi:MAG: Crp/Fnr family transcriptional regulator [Bacteroidota bacterium]